MIWQESASIEHKKNNNRTTNLLYTGIRTHTDTHICEQLTDINAHTHTLQRLSEKKKIALPTPTLVT